jgi:glucosylglycerate phosphorylase
MSKFINEEKKVQIFEKLNFLFGVEKAENVYDGLVKLVDDFNNNQKPGAGNKLWLDEKDVFLITYGDSIKEDGKPALK